MSYIHASQISSIINRLFSSSSLKVLKKTCLTKTRTSTKKCKRKSPYMICQPEIEEFPKILDILEKNYFKEEPALKFLGLKLNPALATRLLDRLNEGNSLVTKCKYTGKILGVALNATTKPWHHKTLYRLAEQQQCPKTKNLLMFYSFIESAPKLFDKDVSLFEIFATTNVFIDKKERNYGLELQLTQASVNRAIERKYRLVRCDATNIALSQILETLGFKLELHVPYEAYRDENGEYIFKNFRAPNIGVNIYTLDITKKEKFSDI